MIHAYRQGGLNIILDTCSGSIHVVDDLAFRVICLVDSGATTGDEVVTALRDEAAAGPPARHIAEDSPAPPDSLAISEIAECFDEVMALKAAGRLWSEDSYEEAARPRAEDINKNCITKALCLHIAHSCNLTCSYCFAGQGRYRGRSALMSFEVGRAALDWLVAHSGERHFLEVDFFGGEPLLGLDTVRRLVDYARGLESAAGKRFRFTLTTNGLLLDDDTIDFVNSEMSNVVLSLDGRREVHDRFRVDSAGRGSWDRVVPLFQRLVDRRGGQDYYIRGTFTHLNPDFLEDIRVMLDLGFDKLSMEPVVTAPGDPLALTAQDIEIVKGQYEELAELMLRRPFTFYHYMLDLRGGPCIYKRIAGCGSGTEYLAVTPAGELYPCHRFVGEEGFLMGDVWQGLSREGHSIRAQFAHANVYSREECASCWARFYCSGGCSANAYYATGSILGVYEAGCELFRKRMECAIYLQARAAQGTRGDAPG